MEVVGRMTLHDEYPHLNALYNLMMGLALREWRRLLEGDEDYPCFLTEADFRRVERSLPDFRYGGFKEMVRIMTGNRPVGTLTAGELAARCHQVGNGVPRAVQGGVRAAGGRMAAGAAQGGHPRHALRSRHSAVRYLRTQRLQFRLDPVGLLPAELREIPLANAERRSRMNVRRKSEIFR